MVSSSNRGAIIKIYSEPGEGTTVKIYLPRLDAAPDIQSESAQDETPLDAAESGESILVVEDDYLLRSYMVETLRDLGYHVIAAADATGALGFLDHPAIRIDMMLTDVVMRGMNCRELAEQARKLRPGLKILFMTAYSRNAVVHQGRVDKDVDLLQKPITQAQLSTRIREVLDRR